MPRLPHPPRFVPLLLVACLAGAHAGCYRFMANRGGGDVELEQRSSPRNARPAADAPDGGRIARPIEPRDVALPDGYRIEAIATGLTFVSGVTVDDAGTVYALEAGWSYGPEFAEARVLRIEPGGSVTVVAQGENPPWTGITWHDGYLYIAEGGVPADGRISRIDPRDGTITPVVTGLPTAADHHTNGPVVGPDGYLYFAVGTATNSGVVGTDNWDYGWLREKPQVHDIPARDIVLAGRNFTSANPFTDEDDEALTGAFKPFGEPSEPGEVIRGRLPANWATMRVPLDGGEVELVGWGMRNPYGFTFGPDGMLYVTQNSFDVRGSRPVWGAGDVLWRIDTTQEPIWYGWPDFHAGRLLNEAFAAPGEPAPEPLLAEHPNPAPRPVAIFGVHASANGIAFPPNERFGFAGKAFVAQFGDMTPVVGKVLAPVGYRVVMVDVESGVITPFAANRGPENGPASRLGGGGLERPNDVAFSPDGQAMYIADFGIVTIDEDPQPRRGTGVIWRVTRDAASPAPQQATLRFTEEARK